MSLILLCGDIKLISWRMPSQLKIFLYVNGMYEVLFSVIFKNWKFLKSFVALNKFQVIYISKTFLNNTYEDKDLILNGYSLLWVEHPNNVKTGEFCIYYKETLALKLIPTPYLNESLFSWSYNRS